MRRFVAPLLGLLLLASLSPTVARADLLTPVIVGDVVVEGGTHLVDFPIVVAPGSSLTFRNATVHLDWEPPFCFHGTAGYCQPNIMVDRASLIVEGSDLSSSNFDPSDTDSGFSVHGWDATFEFRGSAFHHFHGMGSQGPGARRSIIEGNTFEVGTSAVNFFRGTDVDVIDNTFTNVMWPIQSRDGTGRIAGNRIKDAYSAIEVQTTLVGEKAIATTVLVENNTVEGGTFGLLNLNGFPNVVRNNTFRNVEYGARIGVLAGDRVINKAHPTFTGNVIDGSDTAVVVYVSGNPDISEPERITFGLHGNSMVNTICHDITATQVGPQVSLTVDANDNWWGTPAGPTDRGAGCPALDGPSIIVDRWLTSAP